MSDSSSKASPGKAAAAPAAPPVTAADIDASCRWPLLLLFVSGALWLVAGTILSLIVAIKLHKADFLADCPWLTLGRLRPAATNMFLYGFASQAGIGVMLWLMCRLGGVTLVYQWPLAVAWKLWNLGVTVGVVAIMAGASTGFEWLEMPRYAAGMLFVAYAIIGLCAVATFTMRKEGELFPSQWYLLGAVFWFPWIYSAANYLLVVDPVRGTFQSAINAWYAGNLLGLWLGPLALAAIFYFLPRLLGQPLHSRELAAFGFWTLAFFVNFAGLASLAGGPVPRWMPSVGTVASVCLLVPLLCHGLNWHLTCRAACAKGASHSADPVLRFIFAGALCFLLHGLLTVVMALPKVSALTQFTYAVVAKNNLALQGFVGLTLIGSVYYILPRLLNAKWPNAGWVQLHFICTAAGVALMVVGLLVGGLLQGAKLSDPAAPFITIVRGTVPFIGISTLGVLLLLIGQGFFLANLGLLLRAFCEPICRAICADYCGGVPAVKAEVKS